MSQNNKGGNSIYQDAWHESWWYTEEKTEKLKDGNFMLISMWCCSPYSIIKYISFNNSSIQTNTVYSTLQWTTGTLTYLLPVAARLHQHPGEHAESTIRMTIKNCSLKSTTEKQRTHINFSTSDSFRTVWFLIFWQNNSTLWQVTWLKITGFIKDIISTLYFTYAP